MFLTSPFLFVRSIAVVTTAGFLVSASATAQETAPAPAPVFVRPVPVMQDGISLPATGHEGVVVARYAIKADGTVGDVEVVGGFSNPVYENMVKETVGKWTFTPGTVNGEAKDFLNQEYTLTMRASDQLAISPAVAAGMDGINKQIAEKDYRNARATIDGVLENGVQSVFDYALMNQMLTAVHTGLEDPFLALVTIRKSTMSTTNAAGEPQFLLTPDILQSALKQHLMLAAALRQHGEVVRTWNVMERLYDMSSNADLREVVDTAEQQLASTEPLAALGKVVDGSWSHVPTRRIFTVADVREGTLQKIVARCDRRTLELEYQADVDWNLPAGVGQCKLEFGGSDGTLFTIYEFSE
jgi:TonB family protein